MSEIEKTISFKIKQQFPGVYRENGTELVQLVEDYYKFLETETNMAHYNNRRLFEYRDISTTASEMVLFFQKMFMDGLPLLDDSTVKFAIRNIMDLYRSKGSEGGIKLFFRLFYQEDAKVIYPAKYMFKASDSQWKEGNYLQLFPNNGSFSDSNNNVYTYLDLISKNIIGSVSGAKAVVDKVNFVLLFKTIVPIIYINDVKGTFEKYDDLLANVNGNEVSFGKISGSLSRILVDDAYSGTNGNKVGQVYNVTNPYGVGGKCLVTKVSNKATGQIAYDLLEGGWGYTIDSTKLLVSDQVIILDNPDLIFRPLERLVDANNNSGIVIGQNSVSVGVRMDPGDSFSVPWSSATGSPIGTVDRDNNFTIPNTDIFTISPVNNTSPGPLYPEETPPDANTDVIVGNLSNIETISLISDIISDFVAVPIDSADYNTVPPALQPMSGTASPVDLTTPLNQAFALTSYNIGTIDYFDNINPGENYTTDAFALVIDETIRKFDRFDQIISFTTFSTIFEVGTIIQQGGTSGKILEVNSADQYIRVTPYSYYGFDINSVITYKGNNYAPSKVSRDYTSKRAGENAIMDVNTQFQTGQIEEVQVYNSGFGYVDGLGKATTYDFDLNPINNSDAKTVFITDDAGVVQARGLASVFNQGTTSGFWATQNSHLNGYQDLDDDGTPDNYFDSSMKIQDSDYYQEYSYQIESIVGRETYESTLRKNMHLAGTKMFSKFAYEKALQNKVTSRFSLNIVEDYIIGGDPVVGPNRDIEDQRIRASSGDVTTDNGSITADYLG
jgi:hypothetical protein